MTLQTRLNAGLIAIAVVLVAPLVLSLRSLQRLQLETVSLRNREYAATLLVGRMRAVHDELGRGTRLITLVPTETTRDGIVDLTTTLARQVDTLERVTGTAGLFRIRNAIARMDEQLPRIYELSRRGRGRSADSLVDLVMVPALGDIDHVLANMGLALEERTTERMQEFSVRTADAAYAGVGALGIAILMALAIALWLSRSISFPLKELDAGMRAVAEGQFGHPIAISAERRDEFGRLANSYRSMASQLQELDRIKAEFVSVASHELKTPLNVMLGYLQLLQENVYGELTERQREICGTLSSQSQLLARLVRQLLDQSRFAAGGGKLDLRPMVLEEFMQDLERAFRVLALQREVRFEVKLDRDIPHEVQWDSERVNEVLGNLLSNAFKFTMRGGTVSLHVARDGELVRMQVRDSGAGIPGEQLPHIFEKFYQADTMTPTALRGAGLGLAIAKSIVTAHNGAITVESTVGVGTTFTIRMPIRVRRPTPTQLVAGTVA